ncbi:MAG: DNA-directed RNA polymerase subunit omega [Jaaginema sp. PMC 1079.18]|nr:DNA-directed RNA polymerase subunit omega [Jaaginema sp. PMC 1080.18]MEC4851321.1 DNA-directed RNA polymerase subunit omega [Jaaginema sp. PMC 1079.18]MEC4868131.1 DNA-directed RNA polymerase subunit omega [Jaaginema sp. PMC 1078.18]
MSKRLPFDSGNLTDRAEQILTAASNRYRITVQVANRSKRLRHNNFDNFDSFDDPMMKPVIRAIVEISDELTEPGILEESS